jgi:hypothetical protein
VSVKSGGNQADEGTALVGHGDASTVHFDDAVLGQGTQALHLVV